MGAERLGGGDRGAKAEGSVRCARHTDSPRKTGSSGGGRKQARVLFRRAPEAAGRQSVALRYQHSTMLLEIADKAGPCSWFRAQITLASA